MKLPDDPVEIELFQKVSSEVCNLQEAEDALEEVARMRTAFMECFGELSNVNAVLIGDPLHQQITQTIELITANANKIEKEHPAMAREMRQHADLLRCGLDLNVSLTQTAPRGH